MKRINNIPLLKQRRVELRKNQTPEEALLWEKLRQHKLGPKFKRQHSVGPYILDFYCPEKRLAVEVDGSHHDQNKDYDAERSQYMKEFGIKVVRFWNAEVSDSIDAVMRAIKLELSLRPAKGEVGGGN